jgi:hypothetical protein
VRPGPGAAARTWVRRRHHHPRVAGPRRWPGRARRALPTRQWPRGRHFPAPPSPLGCRRGRARCRPETRDCLGCLGTCRPAGHRDFGERDGSPDTNVQPWASALWSGRPAAPARGGPGSRGGRRRRTRGGTGTPPMASARRRCRVGFGACDCQQQPRPNAARPHPAPDRRYRWPSGSHGRATSGGMPRERTRRLIPSRKAMARSGAPPRQNVQAASCCAPPTAWDPSPVPPGGAWPGGPRACNPCP